MASLGPVTKAGKRPFWYADYTKSQFGKKVSKRLSIGGIIISDATHDSVWQWSDRRENVALSLLPSKLRKAYIVLVRMLGVVEIEHR